MAYDLKISPTGVWSDAQGSGKVTLTSDVSAGLTVTAGGLTVTAGGVTITAGGLTVTAGGLTVSAGAVAITVGALSGTPSATAGSHLKTVASTFTDSATAMSGTATGFVAHSFGTPTLAATNTSVTTTDAANVYIPAAVAAGTNETLTNTYALWVDAGDTRLDGRLRLNTITTFADQDATPSVALGNIFKTANTMATTITQLDDAKAGQIVVLIIGDGNTTISDGGNFKLSAAAPNTADDTITLVTDNGTTWYELARAVN